MCCATHHQGWREGSSESLGRAGELHGFVSLSGMLTMKQPRLHLCPPPSPRSLGSGTAYIAHSCRSAHPIALLLQAEEQVSHNLIPLQSRWAPPWTLGSGAVSWFVSAFLPACLPGLPPLASLRCFHVKISQVCLCIEQGHFCSITAVQIVESSRGENKGIPHATILLTSLMRAF